ncbi:MAG: tetratricopeptide repeat protein [Bacteroidia bacterium]|nr:tetratricopeptide repeat protein [Bacteroidia bacterium]
MILRQKLKYFLLSLGLLMALSEKVYAQKSEPELDSLLTALQTAPADSQKVILLARLSWVVESEDPAAALLHIEEAMALARKIHYTQGLARACQDKAFLLWYHNGDYEEALRFNQEAYDIFTSLGDRAGVAKSYHTFANIAEMKGDMNKALDYHKKSLEIRKKSNNRMQEAGSHTHLGITFSKIGMFDSALVYKMEALKIYEELEEMGGIAGVRNNMGIIFMEKGQYNKALENHLKALKIRRDLDDKRGMIASYQNIGEVFQKQGDLNRALMYYQQAMKIKLKSESRVEEANTYYAIGQIKELQTLYKEAKDYYSQSLTLFQEMGNTVAITSNLLGLGRVSKAEKNYSKAIGYFQEANLIQTETGDKSGKATSCLALGNVYLLTGESDRAENFLLQGLAISRQIGAAIIIRDAHLDLSNFYAKQNQFEKAFSYKSQYEHIKDSIFQEEKSRVIVDIQTEYELLEKENQIHELNLQREINQLTRYGVLISLAGIIILSLLAMIYIRYQIQTRANRVLAQQKQEIEAKNKELALSNLELDQFAHVVSHDLKQPLRTISNYSTLMERKFSNVFDANGQTFLNFVSEGVKNLHELVSDLLDYSQINQQLSSVEPVNMNDVVAGVLFTLRKQIRETKANVNVAVLPTVLANNGGINQVMMQLISNAIKFVKKDVPEVSVGYSFNGEEHVFSVKDNGIGIEPDYQEKIFHAFLRLHTNEDFPGTGIGLAIAQKIVAWHKGRIWVESVPGTGSTFYFTLPHQSVS